MIVSGKLYPWGNIATPDDFMGKKSWQCKIEVDKKDAAKLIKLGKEPDKKNPLMFTFKRPVLWPSGEDRKQPTVVDKNRKPLDAAIVGNESMGRIQYAVVEGKNKFGEYKLFDLCAVQVLDLVEYSGSVKDGDEFADEDNEFEDNPY